MANAIKRLRSKSDLQTKFACFLFFLSTPVSFFAQFRAMPLPPILRDGTARYAQLLLKAVASALEEESEGSGPWQFNLVSVF